MRHYSPIDHFCMGVDQAVKTLFSKAKSSQRLSPADEVAESDLTDQERAYSAQLMRINHAGEVCAQALYQGQACGTSRIDIKEKMQQAMREEGDHLAWCHTRLIELGSHTSYLNPIWYASSFMLGLTAGIIGDKWSLGFVAETEKQVIRHLESHLQRLPRKDLKSHKILDQMRMDEALHQDQAVAAGAALLPRFITFLMRFTSKIMTKSSKFI